MSRPQPAAAAGVRLGIISQGLNSFCSSIPLEQTLIHTTVHHQALVPYPSEMQTQKKAEVAGPPTLSTPTEVI